MSFAPKTRKPLAVSAALLVATAGLALSPIGLSAANASNSSSASSIVSSINSYRESQGVAQLNTNFFVSRYSQNDAVYAAKYHTISKSPSNTANPVPSNPSAPDFDTVGGGIAKVPNGSASKVYKFVKSQIPGDLASTDYNYIGVGYEKSGTTVYAAIFLWDYPTAPYNHISESKPTISGTVGVGHTLTAVPHFSPAADSLTYSWKSGSTVLGTGSTYALTPADLGKKITLTISGSKNGYVASNDSTSVLSSTSSTTKAVAKGTLTKGTVTVTGSRNVGQALTANAGTWGPGTVALTYKWLRDGKTIKGQTATTYTQTTSDKGHVINIEVTATETGYSTSTKTTTSKTKTAAALAVD